MRQSAPPPPTPAVNFIRVAARFGMQGTAKLRSHSPVRRTCHNWRFVNGQESDVILRYKYRPDDIPVGRVLVRYRLRLTLHIRHHQTSDARVFRKRYMLRCYRHCVVPLCPTTLTLNSASANIPSILTRHLHLPLSSHHPGSPIRYTPGRISLPSNPVRLSTVIILALSLSKQTPPEPKTEPRRIPRLSSQSQPHAKSEKREQHPHPPARQHHAASSAVVSISTPREAVKSYPPPPAVANHAVPIP